MKKGLILSLITATVISGYLPSLNVQAATLKENTIQIENSNIGEFKSANIEQLTKILNEQGVDEKTQKSLIEKKINGQLWDSENPDMISQVPEDFYILDLNKTT